MPEPLTIYECPECGWWTGDAGQGATDRPEAWCTGMHNGAEHRSRRMLPVRVFRETDVRPLWDWLQLTAPWARAPMPVGRQVMLAAAIKAFPAPADWHLTEDPTDA